MAQIYGNESWFNDDVRVYGCLYVNPSCGLVFQSEDGSTYNVTVNNEGDVFVNNNNIGVNISNGLTSVTENGFTNEVANNGFGTRTVSEGLPGGGSDPDNDIGEDGDTWLVVDC